MTTNLIARARALLAAATPGPWSPEEWHGTDDGGWRAVGPHHVLVDADDTDSDEPDSPPHQRAKRDAALIAAAPTLIAELCEAIEVSDLARLRRNAEQALALLRDFYVAYHKPEWAEGETADSMTVAVRVFLDQAAADGWPGARITEAIAELCEEIARMQRWEDDRHE